MNLYAFITLVAYYGHATSGCSVVVNPSWRLIDQMPKMAKERVINCGDRVSSRDSKRKVLTDPLTYVATSEVADAITSIHVRSLLKREGIDPVLVLVSAGGCRWCVPRSMSMHASEVLYKDVKLRKFWILFPGEEAPSQDLPEKEWKKVELKALYTHITESELMRLPTCVRRLLEDKSLVEATRYYPIVDRVYYTSCLYYDGKKEQVGHQLQVVLSHSGEDEPRIIRLRADIVYPGKVIPAW